MLSSPQELPTDVNLLPACRLVLRALTAGWVIVAVLLGCSTEVSPKKERAAQARPSEPAAPTAPAATAAVVAAEPPARELSAPVAAPGAAQSAGPADRGARGGVHVDTTSGKPPEGWPSEVPLYPGAKVELSMKLARGQTLTMATPDATSKVLAYYEAQLASLQQTSSVEQGKNPMWLWSDASKPLQVTLTLNTAGGKTRATLIVTRERARKK